MSATPAVMAAAPAAGAAAPFRGEGVNRLSRPLVYVFDGGGRSALNRRGEVCEVGL